MALILLTQTNTSGNRLQFASITWPPSPFTATLYFRALYPSGGSGITVIISGLTTDERQMRLENLTSQVPNNAWTSGDYVVCRYDQTGLFVFLGVITNPTPLTVKRVISEGQAISISATEALQREGARR